MIRSDGGRASFAVVAVVLLAMVNVAAVYLAATREAQEQDRREAAERQAALALLEGARLQVTLLAEDAAAEAIRGAPPNLTAVQTRFASLFQDRLAQAFPLTAAGAIVSLGASNVTLHTSVGYVEEPSLLPALGTRSVGGRNLTVLDPGQPRPRSLQAAPVAMELDGTVQLNLTAPGLTRTEFVDLDSVVPNPLPFLDARLRLFGRSVRGDTSEFARAVRYMLTTLVQYRILRGVAWGRYGVAGTTVDDLLTGGDVEQAVNLALLLAEIKAFRSYDPAQASGLDAALGRSGSGHTAGLLARYAHGGDVDPADLFLLLKGHGADRLPLRLLLAQALYARADQGALKYLDYFGIGFVADFLLEVGETLANGIEDFLDWVTGTSKEAEIVKSFLRERLAAANVDSVLGGALTVEVPTLQFTIPSGGTNWTIAIPGNRWTINGASRDLFASEHKGFWKDYYLADFSRDVTRVHEGFEDLAKDAADALANQTLRMLGILEPPLPIDPLDGVPLTVQVRRMIEEDLLPSVRALRNDPDLLLTLAHNQWLYEMGVLRGLLDHIEGDYSRFVNTDYDGLLATFLYLAAGADSNFTALSPGARAEVYTQIRSAMGANPSWGDARGHVWRRDMADLERVYTVASDEAMTAPTGMLAGILNGLLGPAGYLIAAAEDLIASAGAMLGGSSLLQENVLVPTMAGPFEFAERDGTPLPSLNLTVDVGGYQVAEVVYNPVQTIVDFVLASLNGWHVPGLRAYLMMPGVFPPSPSGPNVHYTRPFESVARPFETGFGLLLVGTLPATLRTRGVEVRADSVLYGTTAGITGFSGGPLAGVEYAATDTLLDDLRRLLDWFFSTVAGPIAEALASVLEAIRGAVQGVIEAVVQLAETAQSVLRTLEEMLGSAVSFLRTLIDQAVGTILEVATRILCWTGPKDHTFRTEGFLVQVRACQGDDRVFWLQTSVLGIQATLEVVRLADGGLDAVASFTVNAWALHLDATLDARALFQEHVFEAGLEWDGAWRAEFAVGVVEPGNSVGEEVSLPIPTPVPITVSLGYEISLADDLAGPDLLGLALDSLHALLGADFTSVNEFVEALRVAVTQFVNGFLSWLRGELDKVQEVAFYLEAAAGAGLEAGIRLALVFGGDAIRAAFEWLVEAIGAILEHWGELLPPLDFGALLASIREDTWLRGDLFARVGLPAWVPGNLAGALGATVEASIRVEANVPAIGALFGEDWGAWDVNFGVVIGIPEPVASAMLGTDGLAADLWLLQGHAYPLS